MPTGYTQYVLDGSDFKDFANKCARAFGALVEMRDEPMDAPLPDAIEDTSSKYHREALESAQKKLVNSKKLSMKRAFKLAAQDYNKEREYHQKAMQKTAENCFKLSKVLADVAKYQPPSKDHVGFKDFMIQQLTETIDYDGNPEYHANALAKLKPLTAQEFKQKQIATATRDVAYHAEELNKSTQRGQERNTWIKQLKESLK